MYRGSSFLLQRDYKTHKRAVKEILSPEYELLWDFTPKTDDNIIKAANLLFGENGNSGIYWKIKESYKHKNDDNATDTLITKILMGTFGCIPAFDRYLKDGISLIFSPDGTVGNKINNYKISQNIDNGKNAKMGRETFIALSYYVTENIDKFQIESTLYPPMKCLDMYLWEIGYELDLARILRAQHISETKKIKLKKRAIELNLCKETDSYYDAADIIFQKMV